MPVAALRMLSVTPGITAACVSVTVPWSVAVDCAAAGAADARTNARLRDPMADMKGTTRLICDFSLRRDLATGCCVKPNGDRWREPNEYDDGFQLSTKDLQRHVAVLLRRVLIALVIQILDWLYHFLTLSRREQRGPLETFREACSRGGRAALKGCATLRARPAPRERQLGHCSTA